VTLKNVGLFTLGSFSEIINGPKFLATVFQSMDYELILTKKWIGLHFGRFFSEKHI
jgi:hypothetical protein